MAVGVGRKFVSVVLAVALALGSSGVAHARSDPAARPHLTPKAEQLLKERRLVDAALLLHKIVGREGADGLRERQRANLRLAEVSRELGYRNASFAMVSTIVSFSDHPMRDAALSTLASLVGELPEASEAAERLTLFQPKSIAQRLDVPATRTLYWRVNYRMGRYLHRAGKLDQAVERLGYVDPRSTDYAAAQYLIALCRLEQRQNSAAVQALERAERVLAGAGSGGAWLTDLARLGLGRLHYADAFRPIARGELAVDPAHLDLAIKYFGRVDVTGPHAPAALVEQAWAWFVMGRGERALGNLRTLQAPDYARAFVPDRDLLRAAVHWENCDRAGAAYLLTAHQKGTLATLEESERVLQSYRRTYRDGRFSGFDKEQRFLRFAKEVRAGRSGLSPEADRLARSALTTREIDGHFAYLDFILAEQARLRSSPPSLRNSDLGLLIGDSLKLAYDLAERSAWTAALARYSDAVSDLRGSERRAGRLLQRSELAKVAPRPPSSDVFSVVVYDGEEHVLWPFDGEYWSDEIGSYREQVNASCGADRVKWALR